MSKKYHFISGLPRSGSTLLTAILNQNPKFHSEITDNLMAYVINVVELNNSRSARELTSEQRIRNTIEGIFSGYYKEINNEVIFNTNRGWTKHVEYLHRLNPNFKMICCVRDIPWILNSYEKLYKSRTLREPLSTNAYGGEETTKSVWHRTDFLMNASMLRFSLNNLKEAFYGPYKKHLFLVDFHQLVNNPKNTMQKIYNFIEEPYFEHEFETVEYSNKKYDDVSFAPNLHHVRKGVQPEPSNIILPPDLIQKYSNQEFWK